MPPRQKKRQTPPNKAIKGTEGAVVPIATKCSCPGCGWACLVLADDEDEHPPNACPECNRDINVNEITTPVRCQRCGGTRSVLSITSMHRIQICAQCAGHGFSVPMTAGTS